MSTQPPDLPSYAGRPGQGGSTPAGQGPGSSAPNDPGQGGSSQPVTGPRPDGLPGTAGPFQPQTPSHEPLANGNGNGRMRETAARTQHWWQE
ncbi:MAG TPA: hypothetical protein VGD34_18220, partial [Kribbella sp.]